MRYLVPDHGRISAGCLTMIILLRIPYLYTSCGLYPDFQGKETESSIKKSNVYNCW